MAKNQIVEINKALLKDLKKATQAILARKKVSSSSDLYRELEWVQKDNKVMTLIALDYFEYVDKGRRSGIMPPPQDLIPWLKKNNIMPRQGQSLNQLAYTIATSIKRNGIKGKKYSNAIIEAALEIGSEELAKSISDNVCTAVVDSIKNI